MADTRLLVVEDEIIVAKSIEKTLKRMGYIVSAVVSSGEEAVQQAGEIRPDLVLMDIRLQGEIDGVEAVEQIRAHFDIPIVYLTAYADEETLRRARITEPFGYVLKPFESRELRGTIEMALYRHEIDKKLKESEQRFRTVFETAQHSIFIKDRDLKYTHVNHAMEQLFEFSASELIGRTDDELFGEEAGSHIREIDSRVIGGNIVEEEDTKSVKGIPRTFHVIKVPLKNSSGEVIGLCGIARDITNRKRAENLARIQRDLAVGLSDAPGLDIALQLCIDKAIEVSGMDCGGVYLVDDSTGSLDIAFHKGLPPDFIESASHYDADSASTKLVMAGKPIYSHHQELGVPLDEPRKHESLRAIAILPVHHEGRVIGCLNVSSHKLDELPVCTRVTLEAIAAQIGSAITRLKTEEELKEVNARMKALIHAIPDVTYFKDVEGRYLLINKAFEESLGLKEEDIIGKTDDQILPPDLAEHCRQSDESVLKSGKLHRIEEQTTDTDGITVFFETIKVPLYNNQDDIVGLVGVSRDITDRKRAEKEHKMLEEQVLQSQKLESLGALAGGIAHDFNNLLMGILGNADIALMDISEVSPISQYIIDIKKTSLRAADLCKQMLAYSGKASYTTKPIVLNELISGMGHLLDVSVSKKTGLKYNLADDLPVIEGDAVQIKQVILSLITNASEAIGDETGLVTVTTGTIDCDHSYLNTTCLGENLREGIYVYIEVSDTGDGMDKETLLRIFDPFFSTKFIGRGLGLAALIGIVRAHKGAVEVNSKPGSGTTFRVLFPSASRPSRAPEEETTPTRDLHEAGTILVVDDEETVRSVVEVMLKSLGFRVLMAKDGIEGVDVLRENAEDIDIVILDLTMPSMDSKEVLNEMRRIKSNVRIILSSGYNKQEALHDFTEHELAGFIQKPYEASDLEEKIRKALQKQSDIQAYSSDSNSGN